MFTSAPPSVIEENQSTLYRSRRLLPDPLLLTLGVFQAVFCVTVTVLLYDASAVAGWVVGLPLGLWLVVLVVLLIRTPFVHANADSTQITFYSYFSRTTLNSGDITRVSRTAHYTNVALEILLLRFFDWRPRYTVLYLQLHNGEWVALGGTLARYKTTAAQERILRAWLADPAGTDVSIPISPRGQRRDTSRGTHNG